MRTCGMCAYFDQSSEQFKNSPDNPYWKHFGHCYAPIPLCAQDNRRNPRPVRFNETNCGAWKDREDV